MLDQIDIADLQIIDSMLLSKWNDQRYKIKIYGSDIRVVIFGERHTKPQQRQKQLEFISLIKPEYILHEFATGWMYDPKTRRFRLQKNRFENEGINEPWNLDAFVNLANQLNFSLIGCDITDLELDYAYKELAKSESDKYYFETKYTDKFGIDHGNLKKRDKPRYEFHPCDPVTMHIRNTKMVETIKCYEKISSRPLVVVVGQWHSRDFLRNNLLKPLQLGFAIVNQCTGNHR